MVDDDFLLLWECVFCKTVEQRAFIYKYKKISKKTKYNTFKKFREIVP